MWLIVHTLVTAHLNGVCTTYLNGVYTACLSGVHTYPPSHHFVPFFFQSLVWIMNAHCSFNVFQVSWSHLEMLLCISNIWCQHVCASLRTGACHVYWLLANPPLLDEVNILIGRVSKYAFTWSLNCHRFMSRSHIVLASSSPSHYIRKSVQQFLLLAPCVLWSRILAILLLTTGGAHCTCCRTLSSW